MRSLNTLPLLGSEEMSLVQLYIPGEVAHDTIYELGELGDFQFKDVSGLSATWLPKAVRAGFDPDSRSLTSQLNPTVTAFQRPFTPQLRRLGESARRLRLFRSQILALSPPLGIPPLSAVPPFPMVGPRAQNAFDELEEKLRQHEKRLNEMNRSWEELGKRKSELEEKKWVLRETAGFFNEVSGIRRI
jgi:V-type H+-transporting ATPase subunit a